MTDYSSNKPSTDLPLGAVSIYHIVSFSDAAMASLVQKWRSYSTRRALKALSREQLEDIGVSYEQIDAVAAGINEKR